jgi:hypothetical protein
VEIILGDYPFTVGKIVLKSYQDQRIAGKPRYYIAREEEYLMRVPDELKRCVAFACYKDKQGNFKFAGTVFFVSVPMDSENRWVCTVTAKHILINLKTEKDVDKIYLRMNRRDGGVDFVETNINDWKYHLDDDLFVDVAVLGRTPSPYEFDYMAIPSETALNKDSIKVGEMDEYGVIHNMGIGVGDEVAITGLFINHYGEKQNLPIVRIGNIALMPEEPIATKCFGSMEAYLIESRSIGGLSGSPVFLLHEKGIAFGWRVFLFGLVHGHYDAHVPDIDLLVIDSLSADAPDGKNVNTGIAIVTPVSKIIETINHPDFIEERNEEMKKRKKGILPTEDLPTEDFLEEDESQTEPPYTKEDFLKALGKVTRPLPPQSDQGKIET